VRFFSFCYYILRCPKVPSPISDKTLGRLAAPCKSHDHRDLAANIITNLPRCWPFFRSRKFPHYVVDGIEEFYNHTRMHWSIGYKTPVDVESNLVTA
jgi:hypothetical protein